MRMSILSPDYELISKVEIIIDAVNAEYSKELEMNNDIDDIESLAEMLNDRCEKAGLPIEWDAEDEAREHPEEWMSAMAGFKGTSGHLWVILWERNLQGKWGPITFKERVLQMLGHETIHLNQYAQIGFDKLMTLESGHQKGLKLQGPAGSTENYMRLYLADPHELMAYGHDLAYDLKIINNPSALRSPEAFIEELPVYQQYRRFFDVDSKQIKQLLSYAARYYNGYN